MENKIILPPYHNEVKERILCAAIWYKDGNKHLHQPKNIEEGYVMCGRRHNNIITLYYDLTGKMTRRETSIQGFITSSDRFVDRLEGNSIAIAAGQTKYNKEGEELISEDLY